MLIPAARSREDDLLAKVATAAGSYGLLLEVVRPESFVNGRQCDVEIIVKHRTGQLPLLPEIKANLTTANVGPALARLTRLPGPGVLIADFVNPLLAERLREQGVFFLDAAGNAFIDAQGLFVWVAGRRNRELRARQGAHVRAFTKTGLK